MKIVFDRSVLVAAFYQPLHGPSFSRDIFDYVIDHKLVYVSPAILAEFRRTPTQKLKLAKTKLNLLWRSFWRNSILKNLRRQKTVWQKSTS